MLDDQLLNRGEEEITHERLPQWLCQRHQIDVAGLERLQHRVCQLERTLAATDFPALGQKHEGKVRDSYVRGDERTIVVTDRLSAFDRVVATIPFKGQVLNQLAQYWFEETREIAPNHLVSVPDPNVTIGRECEPLMAEFVMRAYLTGVTSTSVSGAQPRSRSWPSASRTTTIASGQAA